ncbi:flagellar motor switch protein FliM [Vibrio albus]|uniref:Flagellar motor switch protein FliM n=1 Tax=Vibrio albus TaxID=2200953 RepID=A0A2U3B8G1_9VIBR|nr:FliM/FliN family flagellar motor C-terminal domain-containing protein [Vibrio albus]PWI33025.1 flagellar motor switch protein FliM [Vibrio albus]
MKRLNNKPDADITSVSVELLGKPIHSIKNELHTILLQATSEITHLLRKWLKEPGISLLFNGIDVQAKESKTYEQKPAILRHQEGGLITTSMPMDLLMRLSDGFYAADVKRTPDDSGAITHAITSSDLRLQQRIAKLFASHIAPADMWHIVDAISGKEISLRAEFTLSLNDISGSLYIDLDSTLVQTLVDELNLGTHPAIQDKFDKALENTPVRLNTVLCRKTLPLDQVLKLQPDDIINIELLSNMPVSIGQERLFTGHVAEQNGQLVLILKD